MNKQFCVEYFLNCLQFESDEIKIIIDKSNKMLYMIDNGRGANKSDLKRYSTISEIIEAHDDKNGLFNEGVKFMLAYFTQLFKNLKESVEDNDENNLIKTIFKNKIM